MAVGASSWRTTITGLINIGIGVGLMAFAAVMLPEQTTTQAALVAVGLGLLTAGAQGLLARDQSAHDIDRSQEPGR
jgi:hypothetical protein